MSDSGFDPQTVLSATTTEVNEKRANIPVNNQADSNGLYLATIGEIKVDSGIIGKGDRTGQPWVSMVVPLQLQLPPQVQEGTGLGSTFTLTDRVFLDLTPTGKIDNSKGKNNAQRFYREAAGMNQPGAEFSWSALQGRTIKVRIRHEEYNGSFVEKVANVLPA